MPIFRAEVIRKLLVLFRKRTSACVTGATADSLTIFML